MIYINLGEIVFFRICTKEFFVLRNSQSVQEIKESKVDAVNSNKRISMK